MTADIKPVALAPSSVAAFTEAMRGPKGTLDAWLEVANEAEVRAHVEAYAEQAIDSLRAEVDEANADFKEMERLARKHKARAERAEAEVEALRNLAGCADCLRRLAPDNPNGWQTYTMPGAWKPHPAHVCESRIVKEAREE